MPYCSKCLWSVPPAETQIHKKNCWENSQGEQGHVLSFVDKRPNCLVPDRLVVPPDDTTLYMIFQRWSLPTEVGAVLLETTRAPLPYCIGVKGVPTIIEATLPAILDTGLYQWLKNLLELSLKIQTELECPMICPFCLENTNKNDEVYLYLHKTGHSCADNQAIHVLCTECFVRSLQPSGEELDYRKKFRRETCQLCFAGTDAQSGEYTLIRINPIFR